MFLKYLTTVILLLITSFHLSAAERIKGTSISIDAPSFLQPAIQFPGYLDEEYGTSLMVTEMPEAPLAEVLDGMTKDEFSKKGIKLISSEDIMLGDNQGKLLHLEQRAYEIDFLKWMVILGDESKTILVVASYQKEIDEVYASELKSSVLSARWNKESTVDFFEGITFRVKETNSLKIANKMGNNLILTLNGVFPKLDKEEPSSIVAASYFTTDDISDYTNFTKERLFKSGHLKGVRIIYQKKLEINGIASVNLIASATDIKTKEDRFLHFTMIYTDDSYYIIQSECSLSDQKLYQIEFEQLMNSFKLQPSV